MSLPRSYASTLHNGLSRRICKSGIRFAQSIVLGFLRHKRESLNNGQEGKMQRTTSSPVHYSMPPTSGYSLAGLLPSISCLRFTGHLMSATVSRPMIVPPEIRISTLLNGLDQQARLIKRFIVFEHGPGDDQHLGCNLDPGLGLYTTFALAAIEHAMEKPAKTVMVV